MPIIDAHYQQFLDEVNVKQLNFKSYIDANTHSKQWIIQNNNHLIVKINSIHAIAARVPYKYYVIFTRKKEGEGAYGNIYNALEIDPITGKVIVQPMIRPLVAKLIVQPQTRIDKTPEEFFQKIINEAEIQSQYRYTEKPFLIKTEKFTKACLISAYIPGAGLVDDSLVKKLSLLERVDALCQYALQLHSMHHVTPQTGPQTLHRDLHVDNISFYQNNGTVHGEIYDFNLSIKLNAYHRPEHTFSVASREGAFSLLAPEYLLKMQGCLNSDVFAFTSVVLHMFGVSFYRQALQDKMAIIREYLDEKPDLYQKMAVANFNTDGMFKGIVFPDNIIEGEALLKDTIKRLVLRMQHADSSLRVSSDELLIFFINLKQLLLNTTKSVDARLQYIYLAKMLLVVNNLWNPCHFSGYDFHAPTKTNFLFCRVIVELSKLNMLTPGLIHLLVPTIELKDITKPEIKKRTIRARNHSLDTLRQLEENILAIVTKFSKFTLIKEPFVDLAKWVNCLKEMNLNSLQYLRQSSHHHANVLWLMREADLAQYLKALKMKHKNVLLSIQLYLIKNQTELTAIFANRFQYILHKVTRAAIGDLQDYHQFKTHLEHHLGPDFHVNYRSKFFGLKYCSTHSKRIASEQLLAAFTHKDGVKTFFAAYNGTSEQSKLLRNSLNNGKLKGESRELINYLKTL